MKRFTLLCALVGTMALSVVSASASAKPNQVGSAAGVVAAVVQVDRTLNELTLLSNIGSIEVVTVKDSLNNVLQNARFLNNIEILKNFLNSNNCTLIAACDSLNDFLDIRNVEISDVIAIDILSGGDITVFRA